MTCCLFTQSLDWTNAGWLTANRFSHLGTYFGVISIMIWNEKYQENLFQNVICKTVVTFETSIGEMYKYAHNRGVCISIFKVLSNQFINRHGYRLSQCTCKRWEVFMWLNLALLSHINSLAPGGFDHSLKSVHFKFISTINILSIFCEIAIRWMPQHLTDH